MSDTEISDQALDSYMRSKGDATVALTEVQRSENPHSESADPARTYGPEYTPGEREALKTGDATGYIAEQQAVSPVMQRLAAARERAERDRERESWNDYKTRRDAERDALVEQNARLNERLRLFNEAMQPDPDPMITDLQRLRLEEEAEARRDPWKAPAVALRQMRQELNDIHAQRDAAGRDLTYEAEALQYWREHPGFPEIYHGYWQSEYASLKLQNPRATHEQLVQTLRANERALRDRAWQQGISPCAKIEALGRSRYILPQAEREQLAEQQRRGRAEAQRKQEQAAQADYDRRRSQVEAQLSNASWRDLSRGTAGSALDPRGNRVDLLTAAKRFGLAHKFASLLG
jgi:hypothetical protein